MGFKFRYEALLSYRKNLKEKAELELWKARTELNQAVELLGNYEKSLEDGIISLEENLAGSMPSEEIKTYSDYLCGLKERIGRQKQHVAELEKTVSEKREELLARTRQYRVIEKLKEKDFSSWNVQQLQREQKDMNEVAVTRHGKGFF